MFLWHYFRRRACLQFAASACNHPSGRIAGPSGDKNQTVTDNSLFRRLFLDALAGEEPGADSNGDGYITASELGLFLENKVTNLTARDAIKQTPQWGNFNRKGYDRGDFIFKVTRRLP